MPLLGHRHGPGGIPCEKELHGSARFSVPKYERPGYARDPNVPLLGQRHGPGCIPYTRPRGAALFALSRAERAAIYARDREHEYIATGIPPCGHTPRGYSYIQRIDSASVPSNEQSAETSAEVEAEEEEEEEPTRSVRRRSPPTPCPNDRPSPRRRRLNPGASPLGGLGICFKESPEEMIVDAVPAMVDVEYAAQEDEDQTSE